MPVNTTGRITIYNLTVPRILMPAHNDPSLANRLKRVSTEPVKDQIFKSGCDHMTNETRPQLVDGLGLWLDLIVSVQGINSPALFLDRDGVIVEDTNYLGCADDVQMIAGSADAIARANAAGIPVVIVTNQAGIGRGYYDWDGFGAVQTRINENLRGSGAFVNLVIACAYHNEAKPPYQHPNHPWRKPNPGMILAAKQLLKLDLKRSILVGDQLSDLQAAESAGIETRILVSSGHRKQVPENGNQDYFAYPAHTTKKNLSEVVIDVMITNL